MSLHRRDPGIGWRSPRIAQMRAGLRAGPDGPARRQVLLWALTGIGSGAAILAASTLGLAINPSGRAFLQDLVGAGPANSGGQNLDRAGLAAPDSAGGTLGPNFDVELGSPFDESDPSSTGSGDIPERSGQDVARAPRGDPGTGAGEGPLDAPTPVGQAPQPTTSVAESGAGTPASQPTPPPARRDDARAVDPYGSEGQPPSSLGVPRISAASLTTVPRGAILAVPALGIEATFEPTGLDPEGRMLSPASPQTVGWFDLSPAPGGVGNAILSGHVDWYDGTPAVFGNLKAIEPGDEVLYRPSSADEPLRFKALWRRSYLAAQAPIAEIVAQRLDAQELTLITCAGKFVFEDRNYTHRLVVRCGKV